ncbi:formylglycine-generating enzyme family protein [bacterium]|jgi:formylglycine-generating enzyme required for sulfatase activity|nr:formylglycine-generating enzyme family protein [bacterium]
MKLFNISISALVVTLVCVACGSEKPGAVAEKSGAFAGKSEAKGTPSAALAEKNTAHVASPFQPEDFLGGDKLSSELLEGLEVQKTEVTYAHYSALNPLLPVAHQSPWLAKDCYGGRIPQGTPPNYPAACISAKDAEAYTEALNSVDTNYFYSLLSERDFTILADLTRRAMGGPQVDVSKFAWLRGNDGAHAVCMKIDFLGLCDIFGNLAEWTRSSGGYRIIGGSYDSFLMRDREGRSSLPGLRNSDVGFRLVRVPLDGDKDEK